MEGRKGVFGRFWTILQMVDECLSYKSYFLSLVCIRDHAACLQYGAISATFEAEILDHRPGVACGVDHVSVQFRLPDISSTVGIVKNHRMSDGLKHQQCAVLRVVVEPALLLEPVSSYRHCTYYLGTGVGGT